MNALFHLNTLHARATARAMSVVLLCAMLTACGGSNGTSGNDSGNTGGTNPGTDSGSTTTDTEKPRVTAVQIGSPSAGQVQLSAVAQDNVGVTGYCYRSDTTVPASSDACFQTAASTTVPVPAGHLTWRVYARDAAGQVSTAFEQLLDLVAPTISAVTPVSLASGKVSVKVTAADAHGVSAVCLRPATDTSVPAATDKCFTTGDTVSIDATIGSAGYRAHARDASGNVSAAFATRFDAYALLDTGAPTITGIAVSKIVNADGSKQAKMTASALDNHGISGYCFKADSSAPTDDCFKPEATHQVAAPATFQNYKVYAKDHAGRVSAAFDHVLDVEAPVVQGLAPSNITGTQVSVSFAAQDAHGVTAHCLRQRPNRSTPSDVPSATDPCFGSASTVTVAKPIAELHFDGYARDAAGNVSAPFAYTLDLGTPSVVSLILGPVTSGQVTVTATAVDGTGVTGLCLRTDDITPVASDACFVNKPTAFAVSHAFTQPLPTTQTTLKAYARDAAGQVSIASVRTFNGCSSAGLTASSSSRLPTVCMLTTLGEFVIELEETKAPLSVRNFLTYVDEDHYGETVFHRIMSSFMVQAGGFTVENIAKPVHGPITLERTTTTGLSHTVGSVALARSSAANSATSQFFINVVDNASTLNGTSSSDGYAVFGRVISGMDSTVQSIRNLAVKTNDSGELSKPLNPPRILWAYRLK